MEKTRKRDMKWTERFWKGKRDERGREKKRERERDGKERKGRRGAGHGRKRDGRGMGETDGESRTVRNRQGRK